MGTYTHVNGKAQRYYCKLCGLRFSDQKAGMNRLKSEVRETAEALLKSGASIRTTVKATGIHTMTALALVRRLGIDKSKPAPTYARDRREYLVEYRERQKRLHGQQRWETNDIIRASIALWLAKNAKPLTVDQIFSAIHPQFQWLKKNSVTYMLRHNADGCFKQVRNKFTFVPCPAFFPGIAYKAGKPMRGWHQLMSAARAAYFDARGIRDEHVEAAIEKLKEANERHIRRKQTKAIQSVQPLLQIMATASAISSHQPTKHESHNPTQQTAA